MNLPKQLDDRWATPDEVRLAIVEEERQRAAQMKSEPICTCLGSLIGGIFGPGLNEKAGARDNASATQIEREK
jgi:hypothetical protein